MARHELTCPTQTTVYDLTGEHVESPIKTTIITRAEIAGTTALKSTLKSALAEMDVGRMTDDEIIARIRRVLKAGRPR